MSILPIANGPATADANLSLAKPNDARPKKPRRKGPNMNQIHSRPLPLEAHPLPAFHPSNPISLLQLVYTWLSDVLFPPSSHPSRRYVGYFSPETRSVHVTDPKCARILWEMGFFGKGTLSRSEPTWLERENGRLHREDLRLRQKAAEDVTNQRRDERKLFKLERARLGFEKIQRQRKIEEGELDPDQLDPIEQAQHDPDDEHDPLVTAQQELSALDLLNDTEKGRSSDPDVKTNGHLTDQGFLEASDPAKLTNPTVPVDDASITRLLADEDPRGRSLENQEHLQLTFEECFFLSYGLGVLSVYPRKRRAPSPLSVKTESEQYANTDLLELFCQHSSFPPADSIWITPDDRFLLNYVAYHHFRSLGWVVRPGVKFAVDYLLYNRGPVFSHAEFAVLVVPSYTDRYWNTPGGRARRRVQEQKDWWWLHCVNRVQNQVFKTLILCYIDIPSELDMDFDEGIDIGKLLRSYKVREFVFRRWVPNRSRD